MPSAAGRLLAARGRSARTLARRAVDVRSSRVLGGAKVSDKLGVIDALLERVRHAAHRRRHGVHVPCARRAIAVGDSLVEGDRVDHCKELLAIGTHRGARPTSSSRTRCARTPRLGTSRRPRCPTGGRDSTSGPRPRAAYADALASRRGPCCGTVRWACSSSRRSRPARAASPRRWPSAAATPSWAAATARPRCGRWGSPTDIDHVSTGGGASLELIELGDLPGLAGTARRSRTT